jgi:hypothetical protein
VFKRVRVKGEDSGEYLCQFKNDENRFFSELIVATYGERSFPETGFSMKQVQIVAGDDDSWVWEHQTRGKTALNLSHNYDFVFESEGVGNAGADSAASADS